MELGWQDWSSWSAPALGPQRWQGGQWSVPDESEEVKNMKKLESFVEENTQSFFRKSEANPDRYKDEEQEVDDSTTKEDKEVEDAVKQGDICWETNLGVKFKRKYSKNPQYRSLASREAKKSFRSQRLKEIYSESIERRTRTRTREDVSGQAGGTSLST